MIHLDKTNKQIYSEEILVLFCAQFLNKTNEHSLKTCEHWFFSFLPFFVRQNIKKIEAAQMEQKLLEMTSNTCQNLLRNILKCLDTVFFDRKIIFKRDKKSRSHSIDFFSLFYCLSERYFYESQREKENFFSLIILTLNFRPSLSVNCVLRRRMGKNGRGKMAVS